MRTLFVVHRGPIPVRGGADLRVLSLLEATRRLQHDVHVFSASDHAEPDGPWDWVKRPNGLPFHQSWSTVHRPLQQVLRELDPDVTVLSQLSTVPALDDVKDSRSLVVLDCHNVEATLAEKMLELEPDDPVRRLVASRVARVERAAARSVAQVWTCSPQDAAFFKTVTDVPVELVPNSVGVPPAMPGPRSGHGVLFAGSLWYPPNRDAVAVLLSVLRQLRSRYADSTLTIAGAAPPGTIQSVDEPGLVVVGPRDDFGDLFTKASVLAVPLKVGGGTRLKILEAFAAGLPVISSQVGFSGLAVTPGVHLEHAESAEQFAGAITGVWEDSARGRDLAAAGFDFVRRHHSIESLSPLVSGALRRLVGAGSSPDRLPAPH